MHDSRHSQQPNKVWTNPSDKSMYVKQQQKRLNHTMWKLKTKRVEAAKENTER